MGTIRNTVPVLHLLPLNIKRGSQAHCWTVSIRRSRINVPCVDYDKLSGDRIAEPSEYIRARLQAARDIQQKRFSKNGSSDIVCNADMRIGETRQFCKLHDGGQSLMRAAMTQLNLSARAYHRVLKLACTIADLEEALHIAQS